MYCSSIYHSSIFLLIPLPFIYLPSLPERLKWFTSVPNGISELCSITVECIGAQMF